MRRGGRPRRRTRRCGPSSRCPRASRSSTSRRVKRSCGSSRRGKGSSTRPTFGASVRIAAVGDVHGNEHLPAVTADLDRLGPVDLFLLAGDTTDRNDIDAFGAVVRTIRARVSAPVWAVFGNNEYAGDHPAYVARFADALGIRFLQDEAAVFESPAGRGRNGRGGRGRGRADGGQRKEL